MRRINVLQGTSHVSDDPAVVLSAVLGSCIACCLYDPQARVGGMNHFLLPEPRHGRLRSEDEARHYGRYAMEMLVDEMIAGRANRPSLRAHLYGGANLRAGMQSIGSDNGRFARQYLTRNGIHLSQADIGGDVSRRVDFQPALGRIRCRIVRVDAPAEDTRSPLPVPNRR